MKVRDYADVVDRILSALGKSERLSVWHKTSSPSHPLYCLHYAAKVADAPTIYVSAGIHGNEPAGVECAVRLIEKIADATHQNFFRLPLKEFNWLISPCDNPYGYERDTRENAIGYDLNRMFGTPNRCPETAFISESLLQTQTYLKDTIQLALDLHEDTDSHGFYLWERRSSTCPPIGNAVVKQIEEICAINRESMIEDHRNENGVITLLDTVTTKGWTRGRYLAEEIQTRCLILETPTLLDLETRIEVHKAAIQASIKHTFTNYIKLI
ncbi:MAG: M14 family metallocarboxypeptidase [Candidatus Poribacteria bacterium]|nr:M14 family metallocarboxypeptidase [Candidatus Poribacteria bacterium]